MLAPSRTQYMRECMHGSKHPYFICTSILFVHYCPIFVLHAFAFNSRSIGEWSPFQKFAFFRQPWLWTIVPSCTLSDFIILYVYDIEELERTYITINHIPKIVGIDVQLLHGVSSFLQNMIRPVKAPVSFFVPYLYSIHTCWNSSMKRLPVFSLSKWAKALVCPIHISLRSRSLLRLQTRHPSIISLLFKSNCVSCSHSGPLRYTWQTQTIQTWAKRRKLQSYNSTRPYGFCTIRTRSF